MAGIPTLVFFILAVSVSCIQGGITNETETLKPEGRIIGGQFADPNEFPHHLLLFKLKSSDGSGSSGSICGSSLISPEWVLTAAHCVEPGPEKVTKDAFTITAAQHKGPSIDPPDSGKQESKAKEVFIHPCYVSMAKRVHNDIALVQLATPFTLNDKIKIIQIDETDRAKPCTQTTAIGWGRIHPNYANVYASELKKAILNLPAAGVCEEEVGGIHVQSQQCVDANERSSVCQGDSGGPLLCKDGNVNYVCGVASFVGSEACIGSFNVFVRVFHFRDWIKQVMSGNTKSDSGCVKPDDTRAPVMSPTNRRCEKLNNTNGGMTDNNKGGMNNNNNTNSTAISTKRVQPQRALHIYIILTSFLFTY